MSTTLDPTPSTTRPASRARTFWPLFAATVVTDFATKRAVEDRLLPHIPTDVAGDWLRLTLTYNTGAAMHLSVGDASRVVFTVVAALMLVVVFRMYRRTAEGDIWQTTALALIAAGALGTLLVRLRSARGVVDFIVVGPLEYKVFGPNAFPTRGGFTRVFDQSGTAIYEPNQ